MCLKGCLGSLTGGDNYLFLGHIGDITGGIQPRYPRFTGTVNRHLTPPIELNKTACRLRVRLKANLNKYATDFKAFTAAIF